MNVLPMWLASVQDDKEILRQPTAGRTQLHLYFQPFVNAEDNQVSGAEALIRRQNPDQGLLLPEDFLPLAEETGLIIAISLWVVS